jgi:hypothetical protein
MAFVPQRFSSRIEPDCEFQSKHRCDRRQIGDRHSDLTALKPCVFALRPPKRGRDRALTYICSSASITQFAESAIRQLTATPGATINALLRGGHAPILSRLAYPALIYWLPCAVLPIPTESETASNDAWRANLARSRRRLMGVRTSSEPLIDSDEVLTRSGEKTPLSLAASAIV